MNLDIFEKILITLGVFTPMVIWIKSYVIYREYYIKKTTIGEDVRKEVFGDEGGGVMIGDGFSMRPPLPIEDNSTNQEVQKLLKHYNNIVKIFWLWSIIGTTLIIIVLNSIWHKWW